MSWHATRPSDRPPSWSPFVLAHPEERQTDVACALHLAVVPEDPVRGLAYKIVGTITYLFTTCYQFVDQHGLAVLRLFELFSETTVLSKVSTGLYSQCHEMRRTSSSSLSARPFSPPTSCFCSAARARDRRTSNSFERMTHSKCRSRSSYCRKTSFRRSRTLQSCQQNE